MAQDVAPQSQDESPADSHTFSFVGMEHNILEFWETQKIFQKTLEQTKNKRPYIFYDGPPFATGLPHHGHLVGSILKDVVPRYFTMKGRYVLRRFGWDCHGLPIEHEIDKQLNMSSQQAVETLGVAGYNNECRKIVQRYTQQWRSTITRIGRWVDFDSDYKTMDIEYMESVWWVLKQLWDKGYVYQGTKVMPISTALGTVLSNFEAGSNYRDVQDPAITVLFKLKDEEAWVAAWTTTPWTLPSNLALCVGADIEYVQVHDSKLDRNIYLAASRLAEYQTTHNLEVFSTCKGSELMGKKYEPLFDYFIDQQHKGAFVILGDDYVSTDSGTGIVHQAPAFGEDDKRVMAAAGIDAFACPVDLHGIFSTEVGEFAGMYVKDADKEIIKALKKSGALYHHAVIQHSYPFCYRSDTPLIYRAIPSWYVRVTQFADKLIESNEKVHWVPGHIKHGRFGNWLEGAVDWAISRNRVWGTPLPIWINDVTGQQICMGSVEELEKYSGIKVEDLHREFVDPIEFGIDGEAGVYKRISEVLDCWFESGSMPYAQLHYPFENQKVFEAGFPAEFIAEGLDQTRGWFYTLTVLATALYEKPAFRNVIVNGLVLAEDGRKMSKSLKNFTSPDLLMEEFGADALRLYLINSGLVRGEEQRFTDAGVKDMVRRALLPWYNAFSFLKTYAAIDGWSPEKGNHQGNHVLDRWLLSGLQTLKADIAVEMEQYQLFNVVPKLFTFIENLTNWYIRLNRARFWSEEITADKISAYSTLYSALSELSIAMAPFAPFLAEHMYQELAALSGLKPVPESVHLCPYPESEEAYIQPLLEEAVDKMQQVILLGRKQREAVNISIRTPLSELTIIHRDRELLDEIATLEDTIKRELNIKSIRYVQDEDAYIELRTKPNFPKLGKRLGKRMKQFQMLIQALTPAEIEGLFERGEIELAGETFGNDEIEVFRVAKPGTNTVSNRKISVALDCTLSDDLIHEGYAREFVNRVQRSRKEMELEVSDRISLHFSGASKLEDAITKHASYLASETLATDFGQGNLGVETFTAKIDNMDLQYSIVINP